MILISTEMVFIKHLDKKQEVQIYENLFPEKY